MRTLQDYTDEELREELRRRAQEKRKSQKREIVYVEFKATIDKVDNTLSYTANGAIKYKPFAFWRYEVKDCSYEFAKINSHVNCFYLKQGCFKRDNAPQVGDRVKLRYRRTKNNEIFDLAKAKIIEIINDERD